MINSISFGKRTIFEGASSSEQYNSKIRTIHGAMPYEVVTKTSSGGRVVNKIAVITNERDTARQVRIPHYTAIARIKGDNTSLPDVVAKKCLELGDAEFDQYCQGILDYTNLNTQEVRS